MLRMRGEIAMTGNRIHDPEDRQQTRPTATEAEAAVQYEYEVLRVDECEPETFERLQVGMGLGIGNDPIWTKGESGTWIFCGFERVGILSDHVDNDYPSMGTGASGFLAVVSRIEGDGERRLWVRIQAAPIGEDLP